MDVREKLRRFVKEAIHSWESDVNMSDHITDNLIAHGVTVQDDTEITDKLLKQLRNAPLTVLHEEPTIELVQDWIPFDEIKPKDGQSVLGITTEGEMEVYQFDENWQTCLCQYGGIVKVFNITHWCCLPQPPKGE